MTLALNPRLSFLMLVCAIALVFSLSSRLTEVRTPAAPGKEPDIEVECNGPWRGKQLSQVQLDDVLSKHRQFLSHAPGAVLERTRPYQPIRSSSIDPNSMPAGHADPLPPSVTGPAFEVPDVGRADLCGARLVGLDFRGADLRFSRLMGASFVNVNLGGANLSWSYLQRAGFRDISAQKQVQFYDSDLSGVIIVDSNMSNWTFEESDLSFSIIGHSVFSNAVFDSTNLQGATLRDVSLKDASFYRATLSATRLEIRPDQLPVISSFRDVEGLTSLLALNGGESTLIEIREQLKKSGFNLQAQEVNYAINTHIEENGFLGSRLLNRILLGIPYAYGLKPERTVLTGLLLIPVFAAYYILAIYRTDQEGGIWVIRNASNQRPNRDMRPVLLTRRNCVPVLAGLWFSVLSAFRIGWHDFNIGDWIARLQRRDYRLDPEDWTRRASGIQSLISVYLLALAIASYINR